MSEPMDRMDRKDASDLYESGKHRRYSLLFSVNGGAFALAKFMVEEANGGDTIVLGELTLRHLAAGMTIFTVLMGIDIFAFGLKMRKSLPDAFSIVGKLILLVICVLILAGWFLSASRFT